ncbi:MAG TPA: RRQRL motif-containing zinc-binding protein [Nonomuraea sp.]|nr:RRQRL motif-containing zinc-binding protein [Nonomuraea sp.]
MTAEQQGGGLPVYDWRCAPSNLRTRRQLAAQGLRPAGQDIAGKVQRPRRGGREPLTAYLYDIEQAAPKREATPAQRAALEKATRERQLRAAERRGLARAEFEQITDPGPGWADPAPQREPIPGHAFAGLINRDREGMQR